MKKHFKIFLTALIAVITLTLMSCGDLVSSHTHKFQTFVDEVPATCEKAGQKGHQYCEDCKKYFDKDGNEIADIVIPALGHALKHVDLKPATCESDGNIEYWHCERCGKNFSDAEGKVSVNEIKINKLGHDYELVVSWAEDVDFTENFIHESKLVCKHDQNHIVNSNTEGYTENVTSTKVDATCNAKGSVTYTVTVGFDGKTYEKVVTFETEITGVHSIVAVNGQAATTEAAGYKGYFECSTCHKYFEDENGEHPIADINAWKSEGGAGYIAPIAHDHEHTYTKINGKNASCEETGYKDYYYCAECGSCFAIENDPESVITDIEAWKTEGEGKINPLGHVLEEIRGLEPTQTEAGYKSFYTCEMCDKDFEDEEGLVEITDFQAWISEGGNGYLPPLGFVNPGPNNPDTPDNPDNPDTPDNPTPVDPTELKNIKFDFTSKDFGAKVGNNTDEYFEVEKEGYGFDASTNTNRGIQVTVGNTSSATTTITFNGVAKILLVASSNGVSDNNVIIVKVGNSEAQTVKVEKENNKEIELLFATPLDGKVSITISSEVKSVWIKSIEVFYKTATLPEHKHQYEYTVTWEENEAYLIATCSKCEEETEDHTVKTKLEVNVENTPATCEKAGKTVYTALLPEGITNNNFVLTKTFDINALGHNYNEGVWTWADDLSTATVTFTCQNDETHTETVNATVTHKVTTPATETAEGVETYTATATFNEKTYTDTKTKTIHAHTHNFEFVGFRWNSDNTKALAVYKCAECNAEETYEATMTKIDAECVIPDCGIDGKEVYSVSYQDHEDKLEIVIPTDHPHHGVAKVLPLEIEFVPGDFDGKGTSSSGSDVEVTKNDVSISTDKGYGGTQFRVYSGGTLTISASVNITSISFVFSGSYTGGMQTSYKDVNSKSWSKHLTSQARITSIVVAIEGEGETVYEPEYHKAKSATCEEEGNIEYYHCPNCGKNFADAEATTEITTPVVIEKLPHDYDLDNVSWAWTAVENGYSAIATFACKNCNHEEEVTANITVKAETDSTCTTKGSITYLATATFNGEDYINEKTVEKDLLPHTLQESFTFVANEASITIICLECYEVLVDDADCIVTEEASGDKIVLTAKYTYENVEYTKSVDTYTVSWKNGDATLKEVKYLQTGDPVPSYSELSPEKTATLEKTFTFSGWDNSITVVENSNIIFNATFTENYIDYDVVFGIPEGVNTISDVKKHYNETCEFDVTFKNGFKASDTFKVLVNSVELVGNNYHYSFNVTEDTIVEISGIELDGHSITYKDAGNIDFSGVHEDGHPEAHVTGTATVLKSASKEGYTFDGWFTSDDNGITLSENSITEISAETNTDIVLYAKWTIHKHNITILVKEEGYGTVDVDSLTEVEYNTKIEVADEIIEIGEASFVEATPTEATEEFTYTFVKWQVRTGDAEPYDYSDTIPEKLGDEDLVLVAVFERTLNSYTVLWKNGTEIIETDEKVNYGENPSYDSVTPAKESTAQYSYTFVGWALTVDGEKLESIPTVTAAATYYAVFSSTTNKYTVRFLNEDDSVISSKEYEYGTLAENIEVAVLPSKEVAEADKENICYYTADWNQTISNVEGNKDYKVVFTSHEHSWDEGVVTTEATCTTPGVKTYTCIHDSNHTKEENIEPKGVKKSTPGHYEKVTSNLEDFSGTYLIVYKDSDDFIILNGGLSDNAIDSTNNIILIHENNILETEETVAASFIISKTENGYSIKNSNNKYIYHSGSNNTLNISEDVQENSISVKNGVATIAVGNYRIKYNGASNQNRFRYYTSGENISLYIYVPGETEYSHDLTKVEQTNPTCENLGHKEYWECSICHECFYNEDGKDEHKITDLTAWLAGDGKNGNALGHNWQESNQEWNEEHTELTANFVCSRDNKHTNQVTVTTSTDAETVGNIVIEGNKYTATVKFNGNEYTYEYTKPSEDQVDFTLNISNATVKLYIGAEEQTITNLLQKGETYRIEIIPDTNYRLGNDTIVVTGTSLDDVVDHDNQKTFTVGAAAISLTITPVEQITVIFNANGGTFKENTQTVFKYDKIANLKITNPEYKTTGDDAVLTKANSNFGGWFTSSDNGATLSEDAFDFEKDVVESNLVLYAKWVTQSEEITLDFTKISGFSSWKSDYTDHTVNYDDFDVTFTNSNKQGSNITDRPVTKGSDVIIISKNNKIIKEVVFTCKQWGTKAQTIALHYSTNGGTSYTSTGATSNNFELSYDKIPNNTNALKFTFSSSSNQVGITSCKIVYE